MLRALFVGACLSAGMAFAQETVNLECPCRLESSDAGASVTLAVRNFRTIASSDLRVEIQAFEGHWVWPRRTLGVVPLDKAPASGLLEEAGYDVVFDVPDDLTGEYNLGLVLQEEQGGDWVQRDRVRLAAPARLPPTTFDIGDLDYLADVDDDGVGDLNEGLAGTDPNDAASTPGPVQMDVLALHDRGYAELYDHDPYSRIRHVMAVANDIYRDNQTGVLLRLVGFEEAEVDEEEDEFSRVDAALSERLREEYGADVVVMFRARVAGGGTCGWAGLGGWGDRGHVSLEDNGATYATVFGGCGGQTTAHEIGHLMGLGHSYRQHSQGAFRWSRGHFVDDGNRGTVMSYGSGFSDVFSHPERDCGGLPCGKAIFEPDGAHAVASLNAVRFHIAAFAPPQIDRDTDGVIDAKDAFADDASEWQDTDGDGTGNVADADDDGDGVADSADAFPLDGSETADRDDDGVGDNADAFPDDPDESADSDGDGVGDDSDAFPDDPNESRDSDGDGVGDNADLFPDDPGDSSDIDGDGVGDNADPDTDGDGVANSHDAFPLDPSKTDLSSYLIRGEQAGDDAGKTVAAADFNGDGIADFVIAAPYHAVGEAQRAGAVYLLSGVRLADADAADGTTDRVIDLRHVARQPDSWKLVGALDERAGESVAVGDWNGDGNQDLVIGAPFRNGPDQIKGAGAVFLVDGADLGGLDAADGRTDGVVELANVPDGVGSWLLYGRGGDQAGHGVGIASKLDNRGEPHVVVGAQAADGRRGAIYVVSTAQLAEADAADGDSDGMVRLAPSGSRSGSWLLRGEGESDQAGSSVAAGDLDGDGLDEVVARAPGYMGSDGATYVVRGDRLAVADAADGDADGIVELARVGDGIGSWKLIGDGSHGDDSAVVAHLNDDASPDLLLGDAWHSYVVSDADLGAADAADGAVDGEVRLANVVAQPNSYDVPASLSVVGDLDGDGTPELASAHWRRNNHRGETRIAEAALDADPLRVRWSLVGPRSRAHWYFGASTAGDVDGDGSADLLLGMPGHRDGPNIGEVYVIPTADLPALDRVDGEEDLRLLLNNVAGDTDGDKLANTLDSDDDADGVRDWGDAFPLDASEWADADGDGVGDNGDAFPDDSAEQTDFDGDGIGDNADSDDDADGIPDSEDEHPFDTDNDGTDNVDDADDDNDGVADTDDALPLDPDESADNDGDGIGDKSDPDDDNDGVADARDAFPLDAAESMDSDGDGVGDNADVFPNDSAEWADNDRDGVGDNADPDDDNDGVSDADDAFPNDPDESRDSDGDGIGDNADAFPDDAGESVDLDGDGIGDNADVDDDGDGVADADDLFPRMAAKAALTSYTFSGEAAGDIAGYAVSSLTSAGHEQLVISAPIHERRGAVYAISASRMHAADAADGRVDRRIDLGRVAALEESWKLLGEEESEALIGDDMAAADVTGDGRVDLVIGATALRGAAYVVSATVGSADAADGDADGVIDMQSALDADGLAWKLSRNWGDLVGLSVAALGGIDAEGQAGTDDLIVGAPGVGIGDSAGAAEIVLARELLAAISSIDLSDRSAGWRFVGENARDYAGATVAAAGDIDGDDQADILIGASYHDARQVDDGAAYLLSSASLGAADTADGGADRVIELAEVAGLANGWKFVGEGAGHAAGASVSSAGDVDGDGVADVLIGATGYGDFDRPRSGAAYLLSGARLSAVDEADGSADGVIDLGNVASLADVASRPAGWKFVGDAHAYVGHVASVGDLDGDGAPDLLIRNESVVYLVSGKRLAAADAADGSADGLIELRHVAEQPGSWTVFAARGDGRLSTIRAAEGVGDLDGDGFPDLALGLQRDDLPWDNDPGVVHFVSATDLPFLDAADGVEDGAVDLNLIGE